MGNFITEAAFEDRLRYAISAAWHAFQRKVGGGLIPINKEASMQLQYAYLLQQMLPLALHSADEFAEIELETGVRTHSGNYNIDLLVKGRSLLGDSRIAIEMKCYRTISASGKTRGASDIFMKDVYEDLHILEEYVECGLASRGVALVMCDLNRIVNPDPNKKTGKCWAYDISHGHTCPGGIITVDTGGKPVNVVLKQNYQFNWFQYANLWFTEIEGQRSN